MSINRRSFLSTAAAVGAVAATNSELCSAAKPQAIAAASPFTYCLNMSTIRQQTEDIVEQIQIAGTAGYNGIEPWMGHLSKYKDAGGSLSDLKKRIDDAGVVGAALLGFVPGFDEMDDVDDRSAEEEEDEGNGSR